MKTTITIISRRTDNLAYQVKVDTAVAPSRMLGEAFRITNADNRPFGKQVCSTSVGDLMVLNGQTYLVDKYGFKLLDEQQAIAWQQIDRRDAIEGFDWCIENSVITASGQVLRKAN